VKANPRGKRVPPKETSDGEDDDDDDDIYNSDDSEEELVEEEEVGEEEEDDDDDDVPVKGFSDDNKAWLTPKSKKKQLPGMDSDEEDVEQVII
jgi:hypothetical protein